MTKTLYDFVINDERMRRLHNKVKTGEQEVRFWKMAQREYDFMLRDRLNRLGTPRLEFEISESGLTIDEVIEAVTKKYPTARFWGTEKRYDSCVMAIFDLED